MQSHPTRVGLSSHRHLLGGAGAGFFIASSAIIQRDAPAASRGRVMSIMQAAMGVSYGVGLLFIGSIGDATNLHLALFGAGLMLVGFGLLTLRGHATGAPRSTAPAVPLS